MSLVITFLIDDVTSCKVSGVFFSQLAGESLADRDYSAVKHNAESLHLMVSGESPFHTVHTADISC